MSRFLEFIPFIFKWEGGYVNDAGDPGGETNFGIDKRSHPNVDIRGLSKSEAQEIYYNEYWKRFECDAYDKFLGEVFFNSCVNCGVGRARKIMVVSGGDLSGFLAEQEGFYRRLVLKRPELGKFLRGWLNRTRDLRVWVRLG